MSSKVLKFKTPLQALSTVISLPTALMLPPRVFGCVAFVHLHKNQRTKLNPCTLRFDWELVISVSNTKPDVDTKPGVLPLVTEEQQPQQSIVPHHLTVSKDPSPENIPEVSSLNTPSTLVLTNDAHVGYELPCRHNRGKPPDRYSPNREDRRLKYPIANYVSTKTLPKPLKTFADALSSCQVPTSVEEAMKDPRWVQAMNEEMEALLKNKTWILVNLPKGQKTVWCKGVFSIKYKADGTVECYKARLVAKGFTQT
ncbi:putative mitochondrial protein [Vitis vinifera]|uniref:Putative mitochondrial protein n=1 Tax=Vitis vinifera TaxID=29760 RepID=A0A438E397_VITVI|nr:putative mitochondrial protein [Vitis vinifera]RVX02617.1 putative mitochondrial protein [Vitis vinifera]